MGLAALQEETSLANIVCFSPAETEGQASFYPVADRAKLAVPAVDIIALPVKDRRKTLEKLEFCKLVYTLKKDAAKSEQEACEIIAINHQGNFHELLSRGKNKQSALRYANYRHWIDQLGHRSDGTPDFDNVNALCDHYSRGNRAVRGDAAFWQTFYAFYLHRNQLSISESYRLAAVKTRRDNSFAIIPNEEQVRYQVSKLDLAAVVLARHGEEALKNGFIDYIRRDWSDLIPGSVLVGDHRQLDCLVRVWNEEKKEWKAVRPFISAMIDARSWFVVGWCILADAPDSEIIQDVLGLSIYNNNMMAPDCLYIDNGKDFKARGFTTPVEFDSHTHSICQELGIAIVTGKPYNARAKTIERMFKGVAEGFDKWFPSYLGNKPSARPDVAGYFYGNAEELPSVQQFCQIFSTWLEVYHRMPKHGKIHQGRSPLEIWESKKLSKNPWPTERLFFAMLKPLNSLREVQRGPCVLVNKIEYFNNKLWLYQNDKHYSSQNKKVMVKKDIHNPETVYAFEPDGKFICECKTKRPVKAVGLDDEKTRKAISEGLAEQGHQIKKCYTYVNELTKGLHVLSPIELFLAEGVNLEIEKSGERSSVKGASHNFTHYKLIGETLPQSEPGNAPKESQAVPEDITVLSRKEEKALELAEFDRKLDEMLLKKKEETSTDDEIEITIIDEKENDNGNGNNDSGKLNPEWL